MVAINLNTCERLHPLWAIIMEYYTFRDMTAETQNVTLHDVIVSKSLTCFIPIRMKRPGIMDRARVESPHKQKIPVTSIDV